MYSTVSLFLLVKSDSFFTSFKCLKMAPQEFHVLQCFSCRMFQVDIVKKVPKWICKMCGERQSIKKVFGKGTGKECRFYVQEMNEKFIRSLGSPANILRNDFENFSAGTAEMNNESKWNVFVCDEDELVDNKRKVGEIEISSNEQQKTFNGNKKLKTGDGDSNENKVKLNELDKNKKEIGAVFKQDVFKKSRLERSMFEEDSEDLDKMCEI